ncbi:hypothetical protein ACIPY6_28565 [Streptomyces sp. NPDC090054]|uniref:hypothetical protein n=1 Tax=Streptomyces sp. NPDC090054 TaxID=3365933 RepID=UPI003814C2C1
MSSTYYILCLSHDPATVEGECYTPEEAEQRIAAGLDTHPNCDLAISRHSGAVVEIACATSKHRKVDLRCYHGGLAWIDADWLRLLAAARHSADPVVRMISATAGHICWPPERIQRLRLELDLPTTSLMKGTP